VEPLAKERAKGVKKGASSKRYFFAILVPKRGLTQHRRVSSDSASDRWVRALGVSVGIPREGPGEKGRLGSAHSAPIWPFLSPKLDLRRSSAPPLSLSRPRPLVFSSIGSTGRGPARKKGGKRPRRGRAGSGRVGHRRSTRVAFRQSRAPSCSRLQRGPLEELPSRRTGGQAARRNGREGAARGGFFSPLPFSERSISVASTFALARSTLSVAFNFFEVQRMEPLVKERAKGVKKGASSKRYFFAILATKRGLMQHRRVSSDSASDRRVRALGVSGGIPREGPGEKGRLGSAHSAPIWPFLSPKLDLRRSSAPPLSLSRPRPLVFSSIGSTGRGSARKKGGKRPRWGRAGWGRVGHRRSTRVAFRQSRAPSRSRLQRGSLEELTSRRTGGKPARMP